MSESEAEQEPNRNQTSSSNSGSTKQAADQFETAMAQLQNVVSQLEQGNLTLAQSLRAYEQGVGWLKTCYQGLQEVEQQIRILTKVDADGQVHWENFDATASAEQTEGQAPRANSTGREGSAPKRKKADEATSTTSKKRGDSTQPRLF